MSLQPHPTIPPCDGPVLVCVLDGFGENEVKDEFNAVHAASTPVYDALREVPGRWRTIKVRERLVGWWGGGEARAPRKSTHAKREAADASASLGAGVRPVAALVRPPGCLQRRSCNLGSSLTGAGWPDARRFSWLAGAFFSLPAMRRDKTNKHLLPPHTQAHGRAVGLPSDDDMGNSEVGHNALGE